METLYDVTPSQELSLLNRKWTVHKAVVNIATSVVVQDRLDLRVFEEAVRLAVLRWDSFGLRFVKVDGRIRQHFGPREYLRLQRRRFRSSAGMERYLTALAAQPLPLLESPQARFVVFTTPEGYTGLFSVISHLIMDAWAVSVFYLDVLELYRAFTGGGPKPPEPASYEALLAEELAYTGSERWRVDREFWEAELGASQPLFTSIRGSEVLERYRRTILNPHARQCWTQYVRTSGDHVVRTIAPTDVERFQRFLTDQPVASLQVMFHLALRMHMARVNGRTHDVMLGVNVGRRSTLAEKTSGGSRAQHLRFRTLLPPECTFVEALEAIAAQQRTYFRHLDYSSVETQFLPHRLFAAQGSRPGTNYYDTIMSFQPPMPTPHDMQLKTWWYSNGAAAFPCYLNIMDDDGSGGLRCYWERNVAHVPVEDIDQCQDFMVRALRAGVERPTITLGELMDLPVGAGARLESRFR